MFLEERRRAILDELRQHGRVSVKTLSDTLNVSAVTIRQDLRALENEGQLERTYGGAVIHAITSVPPELSFATRQKKQREEKDAIGQAAAGMVKSGYAIALDASTTSFAITPYLKPIEDIIIVTNSLIIAQQFLDCPRIRVVMPAGTLRADSISLVGQIETLPDINLNIGFFGTHGLTIDNGATEISLNESTMKKAIIARSSEIVIIADSTKWGKLAPYTYITPPDMTCIITTEKAPVEAVQPFREAGVNVLMETIA